MTDASPAVTRRPIAPLTHTIALIAILLAIAAYGAYLQRNAGSGPQLVEQRGPQWPLYLSLIAAEWGLFRFALVGLKKSGNRMRDVVGRSWEGWKDVARDVAIAFAAWAVWTGAEALASRMLGPDTAKSITTLLPRGPAEIAAWIGLSISAGICEEAVFRGYLQQQFQALTGSAALAIGAQAVIFGVAHGYQGLRNTIVIAVFGAFYGVVAHWRRNLRPGMVLHAWTDIFGGLLASR